MKKITVSVAITLSLFSSIQFALGQMLEEIVVTAQKRTENLQDIPFSITAVSDETLSRLGATGSADFLKKIPGVSFLDVGPGVNQLTIRGASATPIRQDAPNYKESVGVYLDEAPIALALFNPDLDPYDVQRVEVLRGPQGTLFGSGSLSGTIRYISNKPDTEAFSGNLSAGVSDISDGGTGFDIKGMVNIPLSDSMAVRAVMYHNDYAGFIDRISAVSAAGSRVGWVDEDANDGNKTGGRLAFLADGEKASLDLTLVYQEIEADAVPADDILVLDIRGGGNFPAPGKRRQIREFDETNSNDFFMANATFTYEFENFEVVSASTYLERDVENTFDFTQAFGGYPAYILTSPDYGLFYDQLGYNIKSTDIFVMGLNDKTDVEGFSQELRIVSTGEGRIDWIVGAFYQDQERNYFQTGPLPDFEATTGVDVVADFSSSIPDSALDFAIDTELEQIAVFGELAWHVTDDITATAGLRWSDYEEYSAQLFAGFLAGSPDISFKEATTQDDSLNPRFILKYDATENVSISAQASRGFRLGGANAPLPDFCGDDLKNLGVGSEPGPFKSESLWNYEVSVKSSFANNRLVLNASAYTIDYQNLQLTAIMPLCQFGYIVNGGDGSSEGIEVETKIYPTAGLEISLAYGYLNAEFDNDFTGAAAAGFGAIKKGDRLPGSPENTFNASLYYEFPVMTRYAGYLFVDYQYQDGILSRANDILNPVLLKQELDGYGLTSVRVGLVSQDGGWGVSAYINNVFDKLGDIWLYETYGGAGLQSLFRNQPRTIGASFNYNF